MKGSSPVKSLSNLRSLKGSNLDVRAAIAADRGVGGVDVLLSASGVTDFG